MDILLTFEAKDVNFVFRVKEVGFVCLENLASFGVRISCNRNTEWT